ncbi:MAG: hypothetical protein AAGI53_14550 [Planctomycetota bacterium]
MTEPAPYIDVCHRCRYPMPDASSGQPCPECGTPYDPAPPLRHAEWMSHVAFWMTLASIPMVLSLLMFQSIVFSLAGAYLAEVVKTPRWHGVASGKQHRRAVRATQFMFFTFGVIWAQILIYFVHPTAFDSWDFWDDVIRDIF